MIDFTSQLNTWIEQVRAIAQTGLAFSPPTYDRERYEELLHLAAQMAATNSSLSPDAEGAGMLYERWRQAVEPGVRGYVTPKVGVGAAVFDDHDRILLIQRPSGKWLYPTGWSDVGYTAAGVVVKEVREETGLIAEPVRLIALFDMRSLSDPPEIPLHFYSLLFYCKLKGGKLERHPLETLDAGFFPRDRLPSPLARMSKGWVDLVWAAHHGELREAYFDGP